MDLDRVVGLAYWGAIDYLGESMGWPVKGWNQGVFDISLQPKPDAYFLKSFFSDEPTAHIAVVEEGKGKMMWNGVDISVGKYSENWNRTAGDTVSLYTYTNGDEVELLMNGKSLGIKKNESDPKRRNRIRWDGIVYQPGTVTAVARKDGKETARHSLETTGEAVALQLVGDKQTWHADGKDLQHVRITAVDKKGRRVLSADEKLTFKVVGDAEIVAVDNGNIQSDELAVGNERHLFMGSALVILRAGTQPSDIVLEVTSQKYKTKKLKLASI